jgi:hypothetical protein
MGAISPPQTRWQVAPVRKGDAAKNACGFWLRPKLG